MSQGPQKCKNILILEYPENGPLISFIFSQINAKILKWDLHGIESYKNFSKMISNVFSVLVFFINLSQF